MAVNSQVVKLEGMVVETLPGLLFRVKLSNGREILAHLSGKMKLHHVRVIAGDRVIVEMPAIDQNRGRIIRRL